MKEVFDAVNQVFDFVVPIADFLWGFPTNFDWYASIPILGNLSFAIVILIGSGIFFSIKTGFIQVTHFRKGLRILGALVFIPFGVLSVMAGLELGNLWYISDLGNIIIVYCNLPVLFVGAKYAFRATRHFKKKDGTPFTSDIVGITCDYWDEKAKQKS